MELLMCLLLGVLCMFILLHSSVLLLGAFYLWKKRRQDFPQEEKKPEKSEEEKRAELEMKLFSEGIANILSYDTRPRRERSE